MNETTYIWWPQFGWLLLWLSSGLWYLIGDVLFKNDYIYGYWRWLVYLTICGVIYYLIGQPIISIPIIIVGTYIYINYKIKHSKPSHKTDSIMAIKKEPDNTQYRYGRLDEHPFRVGFGFIIIMIIISSFVSVGDNYILVVIRAAVSWTGVFFIIRGIYLAIKKKVKK